MKKVPATKFGDNASSPCLSFPDLVAGTFFVASLGFALLGMAADAPSATPSKSDAAAQKTLVGETSAGWKKFEGNPVMGGQYGTCFDISVLKDGEAYRMWLSWRPKKSLALVESKDGIHWSEPPLAVFGPRPETGWEDDINRPYVLKRSDGYHLWYTGQAKGRSWIGYATSADGVAWKRMSDKPALSADQPWERNIAVMCPSVIWDEQAARFRMWYSGGEQNEPNAIGYATSPDGLTWKKHEGNPIFVPLPDKPWEKHKVTACQVEKIGEWYVMFYIGFQDEPTARIGLARSRDGITKWQRHPANPIIAPGREKWDHDACYKPYAIYDGEKWLLWYNGRRGSLEQIGVVLHDGQDLGFDNEHPVEARGSATPTAVRTGTSRRVIAADDSKRTMASIGPDGKVEWKLPCGPIHDLHLLPDGHILYQDGWTRIVELDEHRKPIWDYNAKRNGNAGRTVEVHAFQRLPDGTTMIVESGPGRIIEVDHDGNVRHEVKLTVNERSAHSDTRNARKTEAGTYLVAHEKDGVVREYDATGKVVWEFDVPLFDKPKKGGHGPEAFGDQTYSAVRLANGNTLIGTGNGHSVLEVTPAKEIVWKIEQHDLPGIVLAWVTQVSRLKNGNTLFVNCHAGPEQPQIIEVTPEKQIVWTFKDFQTFGNSLPVAVVLDP